MFLVEDEQTLEGLNVTDQDDHGRTMLASEDEKTLEGLNALASPMDHIDGTTCKRCSSEGSCLPSISGATKASRNFAEHKCTSSFANLARVEPPQQLNRE